MPNITGIMRMLLLLVLLALTEKPTFVSSHARLMVPPSRSSMWREGFPTHKNFNDNELYCGGLQVQWNRNSGKCGVCGDPWHMPHPRPNEAGGIYGQGIITRRYKVGQVIEVTVDVTTNHRGYFEFRLCPNNNPKKEVSQKCLDKHLLQIVESSDTKYSIDGKGNGKIMMHLKLPEEMSCTQCVLQWTYIAGNNWGICENGSGSLGCGPQETFRACSDVAIGTGKDGDTNGVFPETPGENDIDSKPNSNEKSPSRGPSRPWKPWSSTTFSFPSSTSLNSNHSGKRKLPNNWSEKNGYSFSINTGNSNSFAAGHKPNTFDKNKWNRIQHSKGNNYFVSYFSKSMPGSNSSVPKQT